MGRHVFILPDVGEGIVEAEITEWYVKPGDIVDDGDLIVDIMTDKATVEIPAPVAGRVVATTGEAGDMIAVGTELAVFEVEGEGNRVARVEPAVAKAAELAPKPETEVAPQEPEAVQEPAPTPAPTPIPAPAITRAPEISRLASPAVRKRARELGIDLARITPSGPAGRVTRQDLEDFALSGGVPIGHGPGLAKRTGVEDIKVIGLRRRVAEKMQAATQRIPHITYAEEIDVTELEALRSYLNSTRDADQPKLTILPLLMRALVKALTRLPKCNAIYDDDKGFIHQHEAIHIGIATQTKNGLMVPVIRHAEARDIWDCAEEVARLAQATRDGSAKLEELAGSTISITSLGAMGGIITTPVINRPEVAIIGVNKMVERPMVVGGQITIRKMMNLSSSFDHRIIDGYDAAELIQALKGLLEHPAAIFVD